MSVRRFVPPVLVDGIPVMVETSHALPLVDVVFVLRTGAFAEPRALEGLARFVAKTSRSGAARMDAQAFEERLASLGGRLAIDVGTGHLRFHGTVIARNLEPFVRLVSRIVLEPAFRAKDVDRVRRESLADRESSADDDRWLAGRAFRRSLFGRHVLGRSLAGTAASLRAITRADVLRFHQGALGRDRFFVGFAGDVEAGVAHGLVHELFAGMPKKARALPRIAEPTMPSGLRIVVVDKPDRTQCQIVAGTLGSRIGDPLTFPLHVANTAFGGMFSGRLVDEIRVKRGYSYGAGSRLAQDVVRDTWTLSTFPTAEQAVDCTRTMLELARGFVNEGLSEREIRAAKSYLVNGRCFEDDTAAKRLDARMDLVMHGQPIEHYTRYDALIRGVSRAAANAAIRERIAVDDLVLAIVGSGKTLAPAMRALEGVTRVEVRSHLDVE